MNAADIGPVAPTERRQPALDLFIIFACANIVATTFQTGASLVPAFSLKSALALVSIGAVAGSLLIALLSAAGSRLGVPSVIAARAALGVRGAGLVAVLLYATNFAWIAVNNVIAASACATAAGGPGSERAWAVGLGVVSTLIVAGGPRLVARADRVAVPLLAIVGVLLTAACLRLPAGVLDYSIVVAVAMSQKAWVVLTGGILGIIAMRLVIGQLLAVVERYPALVDGAFVIIAWVGTRLLLQYLHQAGVISWEVPEWLGYGLIVAIFVSALAWAWFEERRR